MPQKVFIQEKKLLKNSRHHTHYMGDGATSGKPLRSVTFVNGVATEVDENDYQRLKDLTGDKLVGTSRPKVRDLDE